MIAAAEIGSQRFPWWPDWRGECVAIVACGPSVKGMDLSILRDRIHVIAIKRAVELCPWAEAVYGCDAAWWLAENGLPKFRGLKLFHGVGAANRWADLRKVEIDISTDRILTNDPLKVGNGGCSGFQALNLAVQFGAKDIVLVGMDCHDKGGAHWYGRNTWLNANNPMGTNFQRWKKGFETGKKDIDKLGVTVVNACMTSDIACFRKAELKDVMQEWGL